MLHSLSGFKYSC